MYILVLVQNLRPCLDQAAGIHETSHSQNIVIFQVFDIISKLGEGSYGSVYKAVHKESKQVSTYQMFITLHFTDNHFQVLAIKQVPVDTDLQDIIKEISIMQQCVSPYVVR